MSAAEILLGDVEPIGIRFRRGATLTTGATVRARVLRTSDGFELDWSTNTFVAAGTAVQPRQVLTETPASSGAYEYAWNTSAITNPTTPDTYLVEYDQTAPVVRAFLRQSEVRVRAAQSISAAVSNVQADTNDIQARLPAALVGGRIDASVGAMQADTITASAVAVGAIEADAFAADAITSAALATSAVTEIAAGVWSTAVPGAFLSGSAGFVLGTNLDAAVSTRATVTAIWSELVPGAYGAGSAGFNLDVAVSTRATATSAAVSVWSTAVPGLFPAGTAGYVLGVNVDALVSSRATVSGVWSEPLPGVYGAGSAGFYLDAQVSSRATNAGASAAVWSAATRTLTSVALDAGSLTATTIGAGYVAAVQAGLATSSQVSTVPGLVWDELLAAHAIVGSAGYVLSNLGSGSTPVTIAAAVWATPEGAGTMGASLALLRRRTTNRRKLDAGGTITFYDDANLPEKSALLTDVLGGPIVVVPGDPAESSAEV